MCGIAGIYKKNGVNVELKSLNKMTSAIAHRGPDGEGHWISDNAVVGLGHRRLSIIDLSIGGSQPMDYLNGRYTITFNGEIYNYIELRQDLQAKGYLFATNSDTEVILAMYDCYQEKCLEHLDAMFSFAIWDNLSNTLFCARDRMGEKPFFYTDTIEEFVFCSEIKQIIAINSDIKVDFSALQKFIDNGQLMSNRQSFFEGVKVLPPAHFLKVCDNQVTIEKYWEIDINKKKVEQTEGEAAKKFYSLFSTAIERRMRMDVNFGTSLSGGLDSSAIASFIAKDQQIRLKTFSARFKGSELDEGKWIKKVLDKYGLENVQVHPEFGDLIVKLEKITWHHEYPLVGASMHAQWSIMESVKNNNTKVLIDGQGADEYLCGYKEFKYFAIWDLFYKLKLSDFFRERKLFNYQFGEKEKIGWGFITYPLLKALGRAPKEWRFGTNLSERLKYAVENDLGNLLMSADRNSMAHSVEVRLPFTNHELIEFVFSLDSSQLYKYGQTKYVLRNSMKDILPDEITKRTDKIGFAPPQSKWLEGAEGMDFNLKCAEILRNFGLKPSLTNLWNNISVASFLKVFAN
jgi:asparagine synthase (glutamine-hydrolysing)